MRAVLFASVLVLISPVAFAQGPTGVKGKYYPKRNSQEACAKLCKEDSGMDADEGDCMTECATHTDLLTHRLKEGYKSFTHDEAYNEQGGKKMEEKADADLGVDTPDCFPEVDIDHSPDLKELDTKQDGVIDQDEARAWGHKACVPDEMTDQIFSQADKNQDHKISEEEYTNSGENTANEQIIDKVLEKKDQGDDEYNQVQAPPLEEFDHNKDGVLNTNEYKDAVKFGWGGALRDGGL